jgi:heme exporter protein C
VKPFPIATALSAIGLFAAHWLAFDFVPMERTMGPVQRIFYFHVPSAWLCYLGFLMCFVGSVGYLWTRRGRWDLFALASAEVGLIFGFIVLITGPLWARPVWGAWWRWEPRLVSMALMVLIFCAYWVLRSYGGPGEGVKRFAAILGVFGAPNIVFVHLAVRKWRGTHPDQVVSRSDSDMRIALYSILVIMLVLFVLLVVQRYRIHKNAFRVRALRRRLSRLGAM